VSKDIQGTLTILFTDVEGSTDLRTRHGDDLAQEILRGHERLLRAQFQEHEGREVTFLGDGFMVAFGSARKAVSCAIAIQRAFDEDNRQHPDRQIRVRTGLNTGEVVEESGTLYGAAVNAASRIASKARGGQILVSQVVKDLAGSIKEFVFIDRGFSVLKGFPTRWRLYEVNWQQRLDVSPAEGHDTEPAPASSALEGTRPSRLLEETYVRDGLTPIVGREAERAMIVDQLDAVTARALRVVSVEGEAGIGKTRLLEMAAEEAASRGFGVVIAGTDEELRGPFFLLRTLLVSTSMERLADEAAARETLEQARDVLWGRQQISGGLSPSEQMLRVYDMATVALRSIASTRPLALLFDDIQWADEDSLKLIRYLVRTSSPDPIFLMLARRPEPGVSVTPATTLLADLERMRLVCRLRLARLSRTQTQELLQQLLGGPVSPEAAATLHERGEGVPFFVVEFTQAFREARLLQQVEGVWKISMGARSPVPASVQILIERRLAQLPDETRAVLADAAILGRRFRVEDLARVEAALEDGPAPHGPAALDGPLASGIRLNLLSELPEGTMYDYSFTHDEIRAALRAAQTRQRRRTVHAAIVNILAASTEGTATNLSALAYHSLEAGDAQMGIRYSIQAARAAIQAHAPEEALRAIDAARPAAATPRDRAELLWARDDALTILGRGKDRMATLAEMAALATALGDAALGLEVTARRASAARLVGEYEQAADLAMEALDVAEERHDHRTALKALLELGQIRMRASLGESFMPAPTEMDLDGAAEAFERAAALAERLEDQAGLAAARRELGVIENGKARRTMLALMEQYPEVLDTLPLQNPMDQPQIVEHFAKAKQLIGEAVEIYERLGDRRAMMSSLIALAYANIIEGTQYGHAGRIEQIRRLRRGLRRLTSESERAESEAHMLYSIHIYARSHGYPDLSLHRGAETYEAARALGDHQLAFLTAGGVALTHMEMAEVTEAEAWLDRAAAIALESPRPLPARQMEIWRGLLRSAAGDPAGMRKHLERALVLATERGSPAGRCEILALLAIESAYHGSAPGNTELLAQAEGCARETLRLAATLPGDLPWEARAHAALGEIAMARGDAQAAAQAAHAAIDVLKRTGNFFPFVLPDVLLAVARCLAGVEDQKAQSFRTETRVILERVAEATRDDDVRARWFRAPIQAELTKLVGAAPTVAPDQPGRDLPRGLTERQAEILRHVTSGQTNREIAEQLETTEQSVTEELAKVFVLLGVSTESQAAAVAVMEGVA
jgi:predicted ATPase/class 3 adenylate cyclase/DNA-binding CsgD family transcriptional regulator